MTRYSKALTILAVATAALAALPATAGAGCPGCEEYTLDIPKDDPEPAPEPTPAPGAAAPTAPATPVAPATPSAPATGGPGTDTAVPGDVTERAKPQDPDDDPVPSEVADPARLSTAAAVAATRASEPESSNPGGILPLAIALAAVAVVGAGLGIGRRRDASEPNQGGRRSN